MQYFTHSNHVFLIWMYNLNCAKIISYSIKFSFLLTSADFPLLLFEHTHHTHTILIFHFKIQASIIFHMYALWTMQYSFGFSGEIFWANFFAYFFCFDFFHIRYFGMLCEVLKRVHKTNKSMITTMQRRWGGMQKRIRHTKFHVQD